MNYQLLTDEILKNLTGRPKLLLHSCCGPCSSYVLTYLVPHFETTVFFCNPNIRPDEEFEKRLNAQKHLIDCLNEEGADILLEVPENDPMSFYTMAKGMEDLPEGGERCTGCFRLRLEKTAAFAAENGFSYFATTLTVSPHKDPVRINEIGNELASKYGVLWLPSDFKKRDGYLMSIRLSEKYGLYRQDYCGCTPRQE